MTIVYMVRPINLNVVKIGITDDLHKRFYHLQRQHWTELYIAGILHGGIELEQNLHKIFRLNSIRHEWFNDADEIMQTVFGLPADEPKPYGVHRLLIWEGTPPMSHWYYKSSRPSYAQPA